MATSSPPYAADTIPADMLHTYLIQQAHLLFDHAEKARAAVQTPEHWEQRRAQLMSDFEQAIGPFPERTPAQHTRGWKARARTLHHPEDYLREPSPVLRDRTCLCPQTALCTLSGHALSTRT